MPDESVNSEIEAMSVISSALTGLGEDARGRVLRWAVDHYQVSVGVIRVAASAESSGSVVTSATDAGTDFAELFAAADPQNDADKALVGGYWTQFVQGDADFDAQSVNTRLKHLGHGIGNITRALESLKNRRPQLVIQLRKSGTSKQARKKFRVTSAGKAAVEEMLSSPR